MDQTYGELSAAARQTQDVIHKFIEYTEKNNFDGHSAIIADDCVFIYPYAADGAPERIEGRDQIIERALVGGWKTRRHMEAFDVEYSPLLDPEWALIQWRNESTTDDGKPYNQRYVNVVRVVDGKMKEFREYYNPVVELDAGNPRART
jgi:ketosteroid isomerase-like protein